MKLTTSTCRLLPLCLGATKTQVPYHLANHISFSFCFCFPGELENSILQEKQMHCTRMEAIHCKHIYFIFYK